MADELKNKLNKFEFTPPQGSWDKIKLRLEEEFDSGDMKIRQKIYDAEVFPPAENFSAIQAKLNPPAKVKFINAPYYKVAVAAVILFVVSAAAFYLFNLKLPTAVPDTATAFQDFYAQPEPQAKMVEIPVNTPVARKEIKPGENHIEVIKNTAPQATAPAQYAQLTGNETYPPGYVSINAEKMIVKPGTDFQIEAPPITDKNGTIILDMELVKDATGEFMIVTSPNGKQARLSEKFGNKISYLNKDITPIDFDFEGFKWSYKFDEWREQLISNTNFIPTAGNFFDILELKNIIQGLD